MRAILLSLLIHVAALVSIAIYVNKSLQIKKPIGVSTVQFKIKTLKEESKVKPTVNPEVVLTKDNSMVSKSRDQSISEKTPSSSDSSKLGGASGSSVSSYKSLLPGAGLAFENEGLPVGEKDNNEYGALKSSHKITIGELRNNIQFPLILKDVVPSGKGTIQIKYLRKINKWMIVNLYGNPYIRVVLYDLVHNYKKLMQIKELMNVVSSNVFYITYKFIAEKYVTQKNEYDTFELFGNHLKITEERYVPGTNSDPNRYSKEFSDFKFQMGVSLPDKDADKWKGRSRGNIQRMKNHKAFNVKIENEIIKVTP